MDQISTMVSFKGNSSRFNLRSACVCRRGEEILLFHFKNGGFWSLPGGRCDLHENTEQATIREFQEEIGETVTVDRLLWVIENFFTWDHEKFHELLFVYLVNLPADSKILTQDEFNAHEGGQNMLCKWVNPKDLGNYKILPAILPKILGDIPTYTQHLIHHD